MALPDFIIIGAAKSGTTSIHAILGHHPDIFMPKQKEPEFFARDDRFSEGFDRYADNFSGAKPGQLVGEASTIYTLSPFFPKTAQRIHDAIPNAKLIYVMREPVSRAHSYYAQIIKGYQNETRDYRVHRSFEEFIDPDLHARSADRSLVFGKSNDHLPDHPELCLAASEYVEQIKAYRAHFPAEQMLFLKFEDFTADKAAFMAKITDFIGVPRLPEDVLRGDGAAKNMASEHYASVAKNQKVSQLREKFSFVWALRRLLPKGLRQKLASSVADRLETGTSARPQPMTPETRAKLRARFAAQNTELAALTGLDVSDWE